MELLQITQKLSKALSNAMAELDTATAPMSVLHDGVEALNDFMEWKKDNGKIK